MAELPLPTFADVLRARQVVQRFLPRTPLYRYPTLDALLGARVYVKHENFQPIGAFKVRGGVYRMSRLSPEERQRGVITASTGNHGQSIAYAAALFGVRAVVVVPQNANPVKVEAIRAYGAEIRVRGRDFDDARSYCERVAAEEGLRYVSSGDEPDLIAGVATETLEILEEQPDIEAIIVPVGGGSGAAGACLVAKTLNPEIRVIGVQSARAPAAYLTWRHRRWTEAPMGTLAEGLATRRPFMLPQRILWEKLEDFVLVEDEELVEGVRIYLEKAKTLTEPAGAAPLAAALRLREQIQGKTIALILSGGNLSPEQLRRFLH
ncbi:MAG: threonine/serine dehydratase [Anaerolineae bacterium]|uniref:threonine ammonia-lyase n=1 Tax=Thermoflexus sp. TaxID=1969742 RepID=UPI0025E14CCD|nr:threonine/serine dehydratase [Thermoflexus sp.]MCS7351031.1 threonine/serine dehydratase [Thermoflexus sp.]MDW8180484.1 threonine/serine dehydratase [Anaerolineae bacterium]